MNEVDILVADETAASGLPEVAHGITARVRATVVGPRQLAQRTATRVEEVNWFPTSGAQPAEAWTIAVADHLAAQGPRLIISGNSSADRGFIGAAAGRLHAPVLAPVQDLHEDKQGVVTTRLLYGGLVVRRERSTGPICVVMQGLPMMSDAPSGSGTTGIRTIEAEPLSIRKSGAADHRRDSSNLASSQRVVGVGRGIGNPEMLRQADKLADALGAGIACTRPVAEDLGWLPNDRYLGVSGQQIAPDLYLMLGISGELQHMIGVRDAVFIAGINLDREAPAVAASDLTVIGDVREIVPELVQILADRSRRRS